MQENCQKGFAYLFEDDDDSNEDDDEEEKENYENDLSTMLMKNAAISQRLHQFSIHLNSFSRSKY